MHKPLNTLTFLEAQQLFYLYFGPGLASQEYIKRAHGYPDLLIRILILSTVEKWGDFASFNTGVMWNEDLGKYTKGSVITNRGTFQIHAGSYSAMRRKYARYLQAGLDTIGLKDIAGVPIQERPIDMVKDINVFENHVKVFFGDELLNKQGRNLAGAQMDLTVHLEYLERRAKMFRNAKGRDLWEELADPDLSKAWLAKIMSYWVQGGKPIIGKTFLKRESYQVEMLLDHPRAKNSGSNFLDVLVEQENMPFLLVVNKKKDKVEKVTEITEVTEVTEVTDEHREETLELGFEQTAKTDFVMSKLKEMFDKHDDHFVLEVQQGGLDSGPVPTFYNFAVTMVSMGLMETKDISPFLAHIKSSCRGTSFAFSEYQYLRAGQKVSVKLVDLDYCLVNNRRELAISSINTISK